MKRILTTLLTIVMLFSLCVGAYAAELVATEVVAQVSNAEIYVEQGDSVYFNIILSANGNVGTPNTVKIPTIFSVDGNTLSTSALSSTYSFSGTNPASQTVTVAASATATAIPGTYTIRIPITFVEKDKLADNEADELTVHVIAKAPADITPPTLSWEAPNPAANNNILLFQSGTPLLMLPV